MTTTAQPTLGHNGSMPYTSHVILIAPFDAPAPPTPGDGTGKRTWYDGTQVHWYDGVEADWYTSALAVGLNRTWYDGSQAGWVDGTNSEWLSTGSIGTGASWADGSFVVWADGLGWDWAG